MENSQRISHTHLQFATANSTRQNCKRVCLAYAISRTERKPRQLTKAIRNTGFGAKFEVPSI